MKASKSIHLSTLPTLLGLGEVCKNFDVELMLISVGTNIVHFEFVRALKIKKVKQGVVKF